MVADFPPQNLLHHCAEQHFVAHEEMMRLLHFAEAAFPLFVRHFLQLRLGCLTIEG